MAFPRLSPAMIVLVEKGDQALLAWGRQFPGRFFSTLAGFVEPGESLEQAVERESIQLQLNRDQAAELGQRSVWRSIMFVTLVANLGLFLTL